MINTSLNAKTKSGRRSRTILLNNLFLILQSINMSAATLQVLGFEAKTAIIVALGLGVLQTLLGNYLRHQTSERMA